MARRTLAVAAYGVDGVFQRTAIDGIRGETLRHGFDVRVDEVGYGDSTYAPDEVDGVLVIANALSSDALRSLRQRGMPVALISQDAAIPGIPSIRHDNAEGMARLMRHLVVTCQRRHFVYLRGYPGQRDSEERETAFRRAVMRHHLPPAIYLTGDFDAEVAAQSLSRFLDRRTVPIDALVAADYLMAVASLTVLRVYGMPVPTAVSAAGFGDGPEASAVGLTTVSINVREQGRRAALQVIAQIEGEMITGVTLLPTALVIRETCCPALPSA